MSTMDRYGLHSTVIYIVLCHHHRCLDTSHYAVFTPYLFSIFKTVVTLYLPVDLHRNSNTVYRQHLVHIYHLSMITRNICCIGLRSL